MEKYITYDQALHFIAGVLIFAAFNFINPFVAVAAVAALGFAREIHRKAQQDGFDFAKLAFTVAGGLFGLLIALA